MGIVRKEQTLWPVCGSESGRMRGRRSEPRECGGVGGRSETKAGEGVGGCIEAESAGRTGGPWVNKR